MQVLTALLENGHQDDNGTRETLSLKFPPQSQAARDKHAIQVFVVFTEWTNSHADNIFLIMQQCSVSLIIQ